MTTPPALTPFALAGETLHLSPWRALYWARAATLFISDTHFGKAALLRGAAIAAPAASMRDDLARLDALLAQTGAQRLVHLGDMLHARQRRTAPSTYATLRTWRSRHPHLRVLLVRGNHDRITGDPPRDLGIEVVEPPVPLAPFVLYHEPPTADTPPHATLPPPTDGYALAGHVHPGVLRAGERVPCFHFAPTVGVLPAFSRLTGYRVLRPARADRVYVVQDDHIVTTTAGGACYNEG